MSRVMRRAKCGRRYGASFPPAFLVSMYTRASANTRPRRAVSTEDVPKTCPQSSVPDERLGWRSLYPGLLRFSAHRSTVDHLL